MLKLTTQPFALTVPAEERQHAGAITMQVVATYPRGIDTEIRIEKDRRDERRARSRTYRASELTAASQDRLARLTSGALVILDDSMLNLYQKFYYLPERQKENQ